MSDALESYLGGWREADPLRTTAWRFLRADERVRFGALAAVEAEWLKVIHDVSEPQVAAARLGWWREELERAAAGDARHPLTRSVFDDPSLREIPLRCWRAAVDAAFVLVDAEPTADLAAQRAAIAPLATAIADLDTRAWFGAGASGPRTAAVEALALLTANVRTLVAEAQRGRSPLPMNLLARHGLAIGHLATDSPARRAALRDYLDELGRGLADAATMRGSLAVFAAARMQRDLRVLRAAIRADDPLVALRAPGNGFRNLFETWRAARAWRGTPKPETDNDCRP